MSEALSTFEEIDHRMQIWEDEKDLGSQRRPLKCMGEGLGIPELKSGDFKWWGSTEVQTSEWVRLWRKKYIGLKLVYFKGFGGWEVGSSQSVSSSSNELFNSRGTLHLRWPAFKCWLNTRHCQLVLCTLLPWSQDSWLVHLALLLSALVFASLIVETWTDIGKS